jgi:hypothetical protein
MHTLHAQLAAAVLALACAAFAPLVPAATPIETRPVKFAKGSSSATLKGTIKGDRTIDYKLRARAGQTMTVALATRHGANYFNVLPPGSNDVAIFVGSTGGNEWTGTLEADGEYTIRVYLMRSAARRNETASYMLTVGVAGAPAAGAAVSDAAKSTDASMRAGMGKFDATGPIPCAQHAGQPMGQCQFGVARAGGGTATVVVTLLDGRKRVIFFEKGKPVGADISQADGSATLRATKESDLHMIRIGNERYEIPDAVVFGG